MHIYIINLDRSAGRMDFMREQCEALSLDFERVPAVDGKAIDPDTLKRHGLMPGATACFMSHRLAWQRLISSPHQRALILEDDAELLPSLAELIHEDGWFPQQADVVRVEATGQKQLLSVDAIALSGDRVLRRLHSDSWGCAGYIITRSTAERLLDITEDFTEAVDLVVFGHDFVRDAVIYQMVPAPLKQKSMFQEEATGAFRSTIDAERFDANKRKIQAPKSGIAQKLKRELLRPFRQARAFYRRIKGIERFKFDRVTFG